MASRRKQLNIRISDSTEEILRGLIERYRTVTGRDKVGSREVVETAITHLSQACELVDLVKVDRGKRGKARKR